MSARPRSLESHARLRSLLVAALAIAGFALLANDARAAGLSFGPRLGYAKLEGDLFKGDAEPGNVRIFGAQARFGLSTGLTLEIAGEATSDKFDFHDAGDDPGSLVSGKAKWDDLALYASLHLKLLALGPLSAYAGGGTGIHFSQIDVTETSPGSGLRAAQAEARAAAPLDAIDDFLKEAEKDRNDLEWHALGGAQVAFGGPISIFAEGRYRDITGKHELKGWAAYAGFNLSLQ